MPKGLSLLLFLGYCTLSQGIFLNPTTAQQITPDRTTNTTVIRDGNDFTIDQGDRAGGNLFHSFGEFSVPTDGSAFFNNAADIVNIFSRVTGGNISNIDGLLRANGSANLFLLNPAGIVFGENARLAIGGSFFGTTADSFLFEDGEFSATDLDNPPLLTINVPIGLGLGDNPGDIVNRSQYNLVETNIDELVGGEFTIRDSVGLEVNNGQTITLVGGNVFLKNAAGITAPGGRVELGGLSQAGKIHINENGTLTFPDNVARANVSLTEQSRVKVTGANGGFINVNARNLSLYEQSELYAGIAEDMGSPDAQVGDIRINATESVKLIGSDGFTNPFILLSNDYDTAIRNLVGLRPDKNPNNRGRNPKEVSTAIGNAGQIIINTNSLKIEKRASLTTKNYGQGNLSDIKVQANDILIDGGDILNQIVSGEGNAGAIKRNAGAINISTGSLDVTNHSFILADNSVQGDAGKITINARDSVVLKKSQISTRIGDNVKGDAGTIEIHTNTLSVNKGLIQVDNAGQGNAGNIIINARDWVNIDEKSQLLSQMQSETTGKAGDIEITAKGSLTIQNSSEILADTKGAGDAGNITIEANEFRLEGDGSEDDNTQIVTNVTGDALGKAGDINISANSLVVKDDANIKALNESEGDAGNIIVKSDSIQLENEASILAVTKTGQGGNIHLEIDGTLNMRDNSKISAEAEKDGDGGNINIDAEFIIAYPSSGKGNDLITTAKEGDGGNIDINAQQIFNLQEGQAIDENGDRISNNRNDDDDRISNNRNDIDASSDFGLNGTVEISEPDVNLAQEERLSTEVVDLERLIAQNLCQRGDESEFIITGKGGMAPSPSEPRDGEISEVDLVEPAPFVEDGEEEERSESLLEIQQASEEPSQDNPLPEEEIVQAQGWIITEQGKIRLVAYKTDPNSSPTKPTDPQVCHQ